MKLRYLPTGLTLAAGLFSSSAWSAIDTIDIVAVYPPSMANSDPKARIANMEQYANKALENSKANIRFRVVHIEELDIDNAKTDVNTLYSLRNSTKAQSLRSKYGADLVTMMTPTGPYCGVGFVPRGNDGKIYPTYKSYGYSVVGHYCTSSFAHELGHNLTLGHSYKQNSNGGLYPWGRGHGVDSKFVTTMAYNSAYKAPRIQMFSTPEVSACKGLPCGSPISAKDGANAVKALGIAGPQIAAWYESTIPTASPNIKPSASDDMGITEQGDALTIDVLANDVDPDQDTLTIDHVGLAKHGTVSITANAISYTPDSNFIGQDDFEYTITDGHGHTATAMVKVNVGLGVKYKYYEGSWAKLPDFSKLSAKYEGIVHNFSITKRDRDFNHAFRFNGQIEIPKDGLYKFFVKSDDGSQLLIDGQTVVSNNSANGVTETSGSINLTAGLHNIEVQYFQQQGDQSLIIDWQGPNQEREMLSSNFLRSSDPQNTFPIARPDKAFTPSDTAVSISVLKNDNDPDGDYLAIDSVSKSENGKLRVSGSKITYTPDTGFSGIDSFAYTIKDGKGGFDNATVTVRVGSGLAYEYFEGSWDELPDFDKLTPVKEGVSNSFSLRERNRNNNFGFRYRAQINIPADGSYYFYTISDDGSRLSIDDSVVVDNDGLHRFRARGRSVKLTAGYHDIEIEYFDKHGRERLMVVWGGSGVRFQFLKTKDLILPPS
jgi:hypothetical protein